MMFWQRQKIDWAHYDWSNLGEVHAEIDDGGFPINQTRAAQIIEDVGREIFSHYTEIAASVEQNKPELQKYRTLHTLVKFAQYQVELDKAKAENRDIDIKQFDRGQIVGSLMELRSETSYVTTADIANLALKHDEFFVSWMLIASRSSVQSVIAYNRAMRAKVGAIFREILNGHALDNLLNSTIWTAFSEGYIIAPILRYANEMKLPQKLLIEAVDKAYAETERNHLTSVRSDINSYHEWVHSYRWYHFVQKFWATLKQIVAIGEIYNPKLSSALEFDHLDTKRNSIIAETLEDRVERLNKKVRKIIKSRDVSDLSENLKELNTALSQQQLQSPSLIQKLLQTAPDDPSPPTDPSETKPSLTTSEAESESELEESTKKKSKSPRGKTGSTTPGIFGTLQSFGSKALSFTMSNPTPKSKKKKRRKKKGATEEIRTRHVRLSSQATDLEKPDITETTFYRDKFQVRRSISKRIPTTPWVAKQIDAEVKPGQSPQGLTY